MAVTDPVADLLTRIRNGILAKHRFIDVSWSKLKQNISDILKNQGFIENYLVKTDPQGRGEMRIFLKYKMGYCSAIQGLKRVSRPGLRRFVGYEEIPHFYGNLGLTILSTSKGVMSGKEASEKKVGGELLCLIW